MYTITLSDGSTIELSRGELLALADSPNADPAIIAAARQVKGEDDEPPERGVIGTVDAGPYGTLIVEKDPYGGYYFNGQPADLSLPSVRDNIQRAIRNGPEGASGGGGGLTAYQQQQIAANERAFTEDVRQFDASLGQRQTEQDQNLAQRQEEAAQTLQQFREGQAQDAQQFYTQIQQATQLANQDALLTIEGLNAQIGQQNEQLRFAALQEEVRTAEGNRTALLNAQALRADIQSRITSAQNERARIETQVDQVNQAAKIAVDQFNAQQQFDAAELNERLRLENLSLQADTAASIGEQARNPADVGVVAARLRAGDSIGAQIARGESAITERSTEQLGELLGVQRELQKGPAVFNPTSLTFDPIASPDLPAIDTTIPSLADLFQGVSFDPSGIGDPTAPIDASRFLLDAPAAPTAPASLPAGGGAAASAPTGGTSFAPTPASQPTAADTQRVADLKAGGVLPGGATVAKVDPTVSDDAIREFYARLGLAQGGQVDGVAVVGDPKRGKPNEPNPELVVGDAQVIPMDRIGELMQALGMGGIRKLADGGTLGSRFLGTQEADLYGDGLQRATLDGSRFLGTQEQNLSSGDGQRTALGDSRFLGTQEQNLSGGGSERTQIVPAQPAQSAPTTTGSNFLGGPSPLAQQTGATPLTFEEVMAFLEQSQRDTLSRAGITNIGQLTPIGNSAPGTSNFLRTLAGSASSALGFGPLELFMEQLNRLTPRGVGQGVARRTA